MRRALVAVALALVLLTGCGGKARRVVAFEAYWPHGITELETTVHVHGTPRDVYLGGIRLKRDRWTCLSSEVAALYRVSGRAVTVALDDYAVSRCAAMPDVGLQAVGGYGAAGGYVGEWSPGAVVFD